jgi:histidinol-phosphate aminotransferase
MGTLPGKPILEVRQEYGLDKVVKLSSNECPFELPAALGAVVAEAVTGSNRYPDALCRQLRARVAARLKISESNLIFCNGAEEGIRLIAQIFLNQGEKAVIPTPIFDAYSTATLLMGGQPVKLPLKGHRIDLDAVLSLCKQEKNIKLVWLCSPSNPTGDILTKKEMDEFLTQLPPHIMVVLDEAYREFVTDDQAVCTEDYLEKDPRVIGLRTFSKAYGLAGLRIGYIVAHPRVIALVNNVKLPEENYFSYERVDNAAMDIKAGRVDVLHIIADPAISLAEKNDLKIALITTEAVSAGQSIAVTKGNTELLDAINKAIEELKADGTLQALMDKYKLL